MNLEYIKVSNLETILCFFYDTLILWDVPVYIYISGVKISALMQAIRFFFSLTC